MSKIVLSSVGSGYNLDAINSNFSKVASVINDKVFWRDNPTGEPNQLNSHMDANGKQIYNAASLSTDALYIGGQLVTVKELVEAPTVEVRPTSFGAVEDGVADDTAALQDTIAFFNILTATIPATLRLAKAYRVTDELDFSATGGQRRQIVGGDGFEAVKINVDFSGYDKAVFKFGDPASYAYQRATFLGGFHFNKVNNSHQSPVGIRWSGPAQSRMRNIVFGTWDNTTIEEWAPQNCRHEDITMFSGGHVWTYKFNESVTVRQTGNDVDSSASLFSPSDVGHYISLWGPGPNYVRRKTKILTYVSATRVTVDTTYTDSVDMQIYFDGARVTMSAGTNVMTADSSCFVPTDVGLTVYVEDAGGSGKFLRAKITEYTSPTSVKLSKNAVDSVVDVEFATPAVDIHSEGVAVGEGGSDNTFINLQIENHMGVGLMLENQDQISFISTKIHSEQTPASGRFSIAPMWAQQASGYYLGSFDGQYLGGAKSKFTYQTSAFSFVNIDIRTAYDELLFVIKDQASGFEGGIVSICNVSLKSAQSSKTIHDLIVDSNGGKGYMVSGTISYQSADTTKTYLGNSLYGLANGSVASDETNGTYAFYENGDGGTNKTFTIIPSTITWDGTAPSGPANLKYRWQKTGNVATCFFKLIYGTGGVSNSKVYFDFPSDMPVPSHAEYAANETVVIGDGGFSTDKLASVAEPVAAIAYIKYDGTETHPVVVLKTASGTLSAKAAWMSFTYFV